MIQCGVSVVCRATSQLSVDSIDLTSVCIICMVGPGLLEYSIIVRVVLSVILDQELNVIVPPHCPSVSLKLF